MQCAPLHLFSMSSTTNYRNYDNFGVSLLFLGETHQLLVFILTNNILFAAFLFWLIVIQIEHFEKKHFNIIANTHLYHCLMALFPFKEKSMLVLILDVISHNIAISY